MAKKLIIERKDEGDYSLLTLKGVIDEEADLEDTFADLKPNVILNLEGIEMINSCGVREWIHTFEKVPPEIKVQYDKCAPRIVEQMNYVANFIGTGKVISFHAPYFCSQCQESVNVLLDVKDLAKAESTEAPAKNCPKCNSSMEFDDIEEEYFSFLADM